MSSLTLAEVLVDESGAPVPADRFVAHLADYGDVQLFVGHIDEREADRRLQLAETELGGPLTIQGPLNRYWVLFQRHEADCSGAGCECGEADWYPNPVEVGTPGAVAVTTGFADGEW
ncbi:hypothetical protein [Streptomyces scopuliridis]|uniref:hypothetical protein n=1 Tax=Streptomyces scopuliridis TaxID=452529 RepID=UPI0035DA6038